MSFKSCTFMNNDNKWIHFVRASEKIIDDFLMKIHNIFDKLKSTCVFMPHPYNSVCFVFLSCEFSIYRTTINFSKIRNDNGTHSLLSQYLTLLIIKSLRWCFSPTIIPCTTTTETTLFEYLKTNFSIHKLFCFQ
jgi:hypothetical protein